MSNETGLTYHKGTEGKDTAQDDLLLQWELGSDEDGQGDHQHHQIRRDVEDGVDDQMVVVGCALICGLCQWSSRSHSPENLERRTIFDWDGPILRKGSTPHPKEQDDHQAVAKCRVASDDVDQVPLSRGGSGTMSAQMSSQMSSQQSEDSRQGGIQQQQTSFAPPDSSTPQLFHH